MASILALPEELVDLILDELNPQRSTELGDSGPLHDPALGSCLSVSKLFRHLAVSKIFKHTKIIHKPQEQEKGQQRLALLRQILTPPTGSVLESVGTHIKSLSCIFQLHHVPAWNVNARQFMGDENLAFVVKRMSEGDCCVTHFAFGMSAPSDSDIRWSLLNLDLQHALRCLIRSPNLVSLDIRGIKYLPANFMVGAHLSDLRLQQFPGYEDGPKKWFALTFDPQYSRLDCPPLKSLYTDHSYQYLDSKTKLANLKKLIVHNAVAEDFANARDIIQTSVNTLEHVSIEHFGIGQPGIPATFRIDHISNLKTFSHLRFWEFDWNFPPILLPAEPILEVFFQLLDARSSMSSLVRIKLEFYFHEQTVKEDFLHPKDLPEWDRFDALLCGPQYSALEQVSIVAHARLMLHDVPTFDVDIFSSSTTSRIMACLPRLAMHKALAVKIMAQVQGQPVAISW
ncbi:hypothetical protein GALMADRAFT_136011 [Galerina marginata CBS 339.88]|uniref:F-box domain-containing protein n=1 Tax=Galerina marginata (strain CBS 339.88) TaxID=685588 RepID=A0A067TM30_GALM3|nr:hypothetical protein GALMADRAFT_136011 [Galerina marginata CBS 339.88]